MIVAGLVSSSLRHHSTALIMGESFVFLQLYTSDTNFLQLGGCFDRAWLQVWAAFNQAGTPVAAVTAPYDSSATTVSPCCLAPV